jgi:hypothetical protein
VTRAAALAGAAALLAAACAGTGRRSASSRPSAGPALVGARAPVPETRDQLLVATGDAIWRGDLAAAHAALTRLADRERGVADSALDFWSELLALLRCEPLARAPRLVRDDRPFADPWEALRRLVQIERVRLARRMGPQPGPGALITNPREGAPGGAREVTWPVERERWSDELPMPAAMSRCRLVSEDPAGAAATTASPPGGPEVALVLAAARTLPAEHPARPLLLVQGAALAIAHGDAQAAVAPLATLGDGLAGPLTTAEKSEAVLAAALAGLADPAASPEAVLAHGRAALALDLAAPVHRALTLLLADRLTRAARADEAAAVLGPPPHGDDAVGRYIAFRQVEAHAKAGRRAELIAEAREVLRRRGREAVDGDPALTAIMDLALRTLLASPVSAETLEVLESLGPPRERLGRAEAFAQAALEAGAYPSAMATFLWLRDNDNDPSRQLQHLARASVAAARAADRGEFARTFRQLAGQADTDEDVAPPKPAASKAHPAAPTARRRDGALIASAETDRAREKKRAARSVNWQRALLVVARDALPALVENDDQSNLATLVDTLKRHLGDGGRGPVDEELTTLYRAASAHLKSGPRAYAETVGSSRRPILLGDVLVGRSYDVEAPLVDLASAVGEVGPLVFVPLRGNDPSLPQLERWPARFGFEWKGSRS